MAEITDDGPGFREPPKGLLTAPPDDRLFAQMDAPEAIVSAIVQFHKGTPGTAPVLADP